MGATAGVDQYQKATFACGCFWSKEYFFSKQPGVIATRVGYTGGHTSFPTYHQVCTKTTGHAEAVEVTFDPAQTSFETLARFFFEIHDPAIDRRSKGGQYRSAIFHHTGEQEQTARQLMQELRERGYTLATELSAATTFWEAEDRHQKYCVTRGRKPKLRRTMRFSL